MSFWSDMFKYNSMNKKMTTSHTDSETVDYTIGDFENVFSDENLPKKDEYVTIAKIKPIMSGRFSLQTILKRAIVGSGGGNYSRCKIAVADKDGKILAEQETSLHSNNDESYTLYTISVSAGEEYYIMYSISYVRYPGYSFQSYFYPLRYNIEYSIYDKNRVVYIEAVNK